MPNQLARIPWDRLAEVLCRSKISLSHAADDRFHLISSSLSKILGTIRFHEIENAVRTAGTYADACRQIIAKVVGDEQAAVVAPGLFPAEQVEVWRDTAKGVADVVRRAAEAQKKAAAKKESEAPSA